MSTIPEGAAAPPTPTAAPAATVAAVVPGAVDVPSGQPAAVPTPEPGDPRLARLSLNQATVKYWNLTQAVDGCLRAGLPAIGTWREPVAEMGLAKAAALLRRAGLRVSSHCRGGFLTGPDRAAALEDNRRAVDEAAELGAPCLVMVVGGMPDGERDLVGIRERVADGIAELAPYALERGVQLALEPLHPMFCADRAVLSTLGQALDLAERFDAAAVGVVVDAYHVWWDPQVWEQIARAGAGGRIASFQACDWELPIPADALLGRGMVGDGHADVRALRRAVDAAGYDGDIEVEIFNERIWSADGDDVIATLARRHVQHVL
ncbi:MULTISPECIES: sugar phosphate isomerase/epimerase family protein [Nocardiopsis]|uniref:sugar phosphate isomerase/epimerase family protein n=1 Tax=Nocardiopsis TaxID=2013 RepID=UPI00019EEFA3|nr:MULTISPECIES: sugar phosphate isomerase/epimerase family protein [Nocardiopsis]ASU58553.1 sugar phosphate isomerase/epimerase [Nocardiopsis dassonvillei]NKY82092.1 sugar phosphate isomerase/epimerase [Nocardiopsis dassonvillei]VEI87645.1 Hydroxypyruvate isomerase [Nocardiopsis dassonvillei]